ncbi:MAG TPA: glycosyltransferase family 39 protein [Candidatus Acidoferrales bacterium]|nr:glycosyltransferase family 39 protein [Candidatus Acidoferrales bacterium]
METPKNRGSLTLPERCAAERWIAVGIFAVTVLYLCIFRRYTSVDPDEGIVLQGAERILNGEVLYRDFFSLLTPGSYYWLALIFKIFGDSMLVARTALAVYGGIFSVFTYWVARRISPRWIALLTAYFVTIACLPWRFMTLHNWDSTLWCCSTVYCAILLLQVPHWGWAFGLGIFASLTFLFEQSKGAGLIIGLAFGFALAAWMQRSWSWYTTARATALAIGLVCPLALTVGYFAAHRALGPMLSDWMWAPSHYLTANRVPYGYADWNDQERDAMFASGTLTERLAVCVAVSPCFFVPALPVIGAASLPHWIISGRKGNVAIDRAVFYTLVSATVGGLLLSVAGTRASNLHLVYLAPIFYLALGCILDGSDISSALLRRIQPVLTIALFISFTAVGMALLVADRSAGHVVETSRGEVTTRVPDRVLEYTQAHLPPGTRTLVYPYLPLYYYLTDTFSAARYDYLQPGMHTAKQNLEMVHDIDAHCPAAILFEPAFYEKISTSWPNTSPGLWANDPVAEYILRNYQWCATLTSGANSRFLFMVPAGAACPGDARRPELDR